jgi:hypothetical protein
LNNGNLEERIVAAGENYVPLRSAVQTLLLQKYLALRLSVKYIGGQYTERPHKGDPGDNLPLEPLPASKQREALAFLVESAFSADAFALPPELLNKLADNKIVDWENRLYIYGRRFDFPLITWVGAIQNTILYYLLQPMLLQRVLETEYKVEEPFRLAELFGTLTKAIWLDTPAPSGKTAVMQRNLQRFYVRMLTQMVVQPSMGTPEDAVALARLNLVRVRGSIETALREPGLGDETNAHLMESKARIDRALEAKLQSSF